MGEAVPVPDDLVQDVRLGRVERHRVVPDVLRRVEDPVREGAVELQQGHQPGGGHVPEPRERAQELVHLDELRDAGLRKPQPLLALEVDGAGQALVQTMQLAADDPPHVVLGLGVGRNGGGVPGCHSMASAARALRRARYSGSTAPGWLSLR